MINQLVKYKHKEEGLLLRKQTEKMLKKPVSNGTMCARRMCRELLMRKMTLSSAKVALNVQPLYCGRNRVANLT